MPRQARDSVLQPVKPRLDRTALVLRHRRLVYLVAWSHTGSGLEIDDLVQEGMCGLLIAADRYDPGRGVRFWTYARYWVREAIRNAIFEHSPLVHVPAYLIRLINHAMTRLSAMLGRLPTIAELAEALEIDPDTCERAFRALDRPVSLSAPAEHEDAPLSEAIPDTGAGDPETLALDGAAREELDRLLDALPARERVILRSRFGLDGPARTFEELAQMCTLSSARVRQLYCAALARLHDIVSTERAN